MYGFTLLWADRVDEAAATLGEATQMADRVADATLLLRSSAYHGCALRRARATDEAGSGSAAGRCCSLRRPAAPDTLRSVTPIWRGWRTNGETTPGPSHGARQPTESGRRARDRRVDRNSSVRTSPGLAVWPAAAAKLALGDVEAVPRDLAFLLTPVERPMPPALRSAVEVAVDRGNAADLQSALDLARSHKFL